MKKLLALIAIAGFLASCTNAGTEKSTKDSLDSIEKAKKAVIDSSANQKKEAVDQKYDSLKNKVDSTHKDTSAKK